MGTGFAPTWLRHVSPPPPASHEHFNHWVFVMCLFFVTLRGLHAVRSMVTYFEQVLCRGLWVDFDTVYIVFQH